MSRTYIPEHLSKKDKIKQEKEIKKSKKFYKKGKYHLRKKIDSFKSKKSGHVENAKKLYKVEKISANKELAKKTKCKKSALTKIVNKGMGAYYSSGSRPSQTAHSWGYARLASVLLKRNAYKIDKHILDEYNVKLK